jgi:hypothetical protein
MFCHPCAMSAGVKLPLIFPKSEPACNHLPKQRSGEEENAGVKREFFIDGSIEPSLIGQQCFPPYLLRFNFFASPRLCGKISPCP